MDRPDPPRPAGLSPAEERWARRLAHAQAARDELVRLLGLLRILGGIATQSEGLEEGAQAISQHLVHYLGLEYCGFYVREEGQDKLRASYGATPSPEIQDILLHRVGEGSTYSGRLGQGDGQSQLACLPLMGASERLGGLAMILGRSLGLAQRRHLTMVGEAVAPVLETFLLRGRLQAFNQDLRQQTRRAALSLAELDRAHQEAEACLEGLFLGDPEPLFVLDTEGSLRRCNPALENLLGWSRDHLMGRQLVDFLVEPTDWQEVSRCLDHGRNILDCQLSLLVQAGTRLPARLCLRHFFQGGQLAGTMGRLTQASEPHLASQGLFSREEMEELIRRCAEAGNQVNNLLGALRAHLQLALLQDLEPDLRRRLELLEDLAEDSRGMTRQVGEFLDYLRQKCRQAQTRSQLWPEDGGLLVPAGPAPGPEEAS